MNLLLVASAGLIAAGADWFLAVWANSESPAPSRLVAGLALYVAAMFLFALSLRRGTLVVNGATFAVINGLAVVIVSRIALRESISPIQWTGVALAVAALVLLEL